MFKFQCKLSLYFNTDVGIALILGSHAFFAPENLRDYFKSYEVVEATE